MKETTHTLIVHINYTEKGLETASASESYE